MGIRSPETKAAELTSDHRRTGMTSMGVCVTGGVLPNFLSGKKKLQGIS
jgi:hypothetical protein